VTDLRARARALVAQGKGILAVDDFTPGITKRFEKHGIASTPETRRDYREMLFTSQGLRDHVSGVILYDETFHQTARSGQTIPDLITAGGALVGIKLDLGQVELSNTGGELITQGLDHLAARIADYKSKGASFAKWRAVLSISETLPSANAIAANVHALARYAAICQTEGLVPIVEPDILMTGDHSVERCAEVTALVLNQQFAALAMAGVDLTAMILKPNMVTPGASAPCQASPAEVATQTRAVLLANVPATVAGIAFLSGGQSSIAATNHLHLITAGHQLPWPVTFSYNRALQDDALKAWGGFAANIPQAQAAFTHRAKMNALAAQGQWTITQE
jgi:fructose-bisphosphate aldolase, class I